MNYLQNIPSNAIEYGINKLLTVRFLSIDWKHRDTEINVRTPKLLDTVTTLMDTRAIFKHRANQLRYIYHLPRNILSDVKPDSLLKVPYIPNNLSLLSVYSDIIVDYKWLVEDSNKDLYRELVENSKTIILFSLNVPEKVMLNFLITHNLPIPTKIRKYSFKKFVKRLGKSICSLFYDARSLSNLQIELLWVLNTHLYRVDLNGYYRNIRFKTDKKLRKGLR